MTVQHVKGTIQLSSLTHCIAQICYCVWFIIYSKLKGDPWRHNCDISARCVNTIGKLSACISTPYTVSSIHACAHLSIVSAVYTLQQCMCNYEYICASDHVCVQRADAIIYNYSLLLLLLLLLLLDDHANCYCYR
jgi:hypothetical protein